MIWSDGLVLDWTVLSRSKFMKLEPACVRLGLAPGTAERDFLALIIWESSSVDLGRFEEGPRLFEESTVLLASGNLSQTNQRLRPKASAYLRTSP